MLLYSVLAMFLLAGGSGSGSAACASVDKSADTAVTTADTTPAEASRGSRIPVSVVVLQAVLRLTTD